MAARIVPGKFCSIEGCQTGVTSLGYCSKHYQRFSRYGDPLFTKIERYKGPCSVAGCKNKSVSKKLCGAHYSKMMKMGDPCKYAKKYRRRISWIESHAGHCGDECLIWPFSTSDHGRGVVTIAKRNLSAPRAMCILAHGNPPTRSHEAAHSCGNGHLGCVNPRHLRWATRSENVADQRLHGTLRRGSAVNTSKLSAGDVERIRGLRGIRKGAVLAEEYGVSPAAISSILTGKSWAWL